MSPSLLSRLWPGGMPLWIGKRRAGRFLFRFTFGTLEGAHLPGSAPPAGEPQQHGDGSSGLCPTPTAPPRPGWAAEAPTCLEAAESLRGALAKGMRTLQQRLCWSVETRGHVEDMGETKRGRRAEAASEHAGAQARGTLRDVTCSHTSSRALGPGGSWAATASREQPG